MSSSGTHPSSQSLAHRKGADYFDLESIVFSQTVIPVTASVNVHGLGFLDPSAQDETDLSAGAEMKLPIWLAEPLTRKRVTSATLPKTHAKAIRQELRMDAVSVSLAQNQYIYELGALLATLTGDVELPPLLSETFSARFAQLWDNARNWREEDTSRATSTMCVSEKRLFSSGYDSISDYFDWAHHAKKGITAAPIVQSVSRNRKRPRPD